MCRYNIKLGEYIMDTIKLSEAIKLTKKKDDGGYPKGWEYLKRDELGNNIIFLPTKKVVDKFIEVIGDKWNIKGKIDMIKYDLLNTNIVIDGKYIFARGGLCPGGVRLFEIIGE